MFGWKRLKRALLFDFNYWKPSLQAIVLANRSGFIYNFCNNEHPFTIGVHLIARFVIIVTNVNYLFGWKRLKRTWTLLFGFNYWERFLQTTVS